MNKLFIDNESYNIEEDNITISLTVLRLVVMYKETLMLTLLK